jgi:DNA adenine methylase
MKRVPHVIPYQGSKRKLADDILGLVNFEIDTLYEPFAGSGAITLAAATHGIAKNFVVGDKLVSLADLWTMIVNKPDQLIKEYSRIWSDQLEDPAAHYKKIRDDFNRENQPAALLYLIARCVKNAIRFNAAGAFNQGPDNRRLGVKPEKIERDILAMSAMLKGRVDIHAKDFREINKTATSADLVYMDPPWQGTSGKRDPRYAHLLDLDDLIDELDSLNRRAVPYMLSFDGTCGGRSYGEALPEHLNLLHVPLYAGRSSQATLLGRTDETIESLYLSPAFCEKAEKKKMKRRQSQLEIAI